MRLAGVITEGLLAWVVGAVLIFSVLALPVQCSMKQDAMLVEAIKAGADPLEARCALEGSNSQSQLCLAVALGKNKKNNGGNDDSTEQ